MSGPGVTLSASAAIMKSRSVFVSGRLMRSSLRDHLHVAKLALPHRGIVAEHGTDEVPPPQRLRIPAAIAIELRPGSFMDRLRALDRLGGLDSLASHPAAADLRMENLIRPIVVVEVRREGIA